MEKKIQNKDTDSCRRQHLHELLIALIQKQQEIELIDTEPSALERNTYPPSQQDSASWLVRNRRVIKHYQALVRTAVTLDALLDAEHSGSG